MQRILGFITVLVFLVSCKAKKAYISEGDASDIIPAATIVNNHYKNSADFKTLYVKASAKYEDANNSQNVTAELRIKKDQKVLISIRFLGITMAKALITPNKVSYYEKINNTYFEGDYALLSRWLGTELNYTNVENLLTGKAIDDLTKDKFLVTIYENLFRLQSNGTAEINRIYDFEAENYFIKREEIIQLKAQRSLSVEYPRFQKVNSIALPAAIDIKAIQNNQITSIKVEYNTVNLNEDLTFPFSIPDGFEQIFIN